MTDETVARAARAGNPWPSAPLEIARACVRRGWAPIPIPYREKGPRLSGWQRLRLGEADLAKYFNGAPLNVGVLLGTPSGGLTDIDLDCAEAIRAAPDFLPTTGAIFGRAGKWLSHYLYVTGIEARTALSDPETGEVLLEVRGGSDAKGAQTVFPGSVHPSGETITWAIDGEPAEVKDAELQSAAQRLAAAALLARHGFQEHARHEDTLTVEGWLTRAGWTEDQVADFVAGVVRAAGGDPDLAKRRAVARDAANRLDADRPVRGWTAFTERFGPKVANKVAEWLGIEGGGLFEHRPETWDRAGDDRQSAGFAAGAARSQWPQPPAEAAFHGLAGEVVAAIEPHSEAAREALLIQFLAAFGNALGRGPYYAVEGDRHHCNLFAVLVGETAKGRKGTSWGRIRQIFDLVATDWVQGRVHTGLSSGEGLIWAVRDPIKGMERAGKGDDIRYVEVEKDPGIADKRLFVLESEFANVLRMTQREGNTVSNIIRDAWDRGTLSAMTKNNPARATGAHVSIVGHITADELRRYLDRTEAANGFANRFLFLCVRRSKELPFGGALDTSTVNALAHKVAVALERARRIGAVGMDAGARAAWARVYGDLSAGRPGLLGAVTGRAEAQAIRLALLYALLDGSHDIRTPHLMAALELWAYCEDSARHIFGETIGDPLADAILGMLRAAGPEGMTRWDISNAFGRNQARAAIDRALDLLGRHGLARREMKSTGGRAREVWRAV